MPCFDAWRYDSLYKTRKVSKGLFAAILPCGLPAAIFKIISSTGTHPSHTLCAAAHYAPSMALQPEAEIVLKTE